MYEIELTDYGRVLKPLTGWQDSFVEIIKKEKLVGVYLNAASGWQKEENFNFLLSVPEIEYLKILDHSAGNYEIINTLHQLKSLTISTYECVPIDLKNFPKLDYLAIYWHQEIINLSSCKRLRELYIYKYKSTDFVEIGQCENLEILRMSISTALSLQGIRGLSKLNKIDLAYFSKLEDIEELSELKNLLKINLQNCRKIKNFIENISTLTALDSIVLDNIPSIASLKPLQDFKKLRWLDFSEVNIEDGKIAFLKDLPNLKTVIFENRKHYDMSREELKEILDAKHQK